MTSDELEVRWERLIGWLRSQHPGYEAKVKWKEVPGAGRGLFTTRAVKAGETLLDIPSTALLNPLTLINKTSIPAHLFPQPSTRQRPRAKKPRLSLSDKTQPAGRSRTLNTTQLLTLHLLLTRDSQGRHPSPWGPYIDTLPKSFTPWHPLARRILYCSIDGAQTDHTSTAKRKGKMSEQRWAWLIECLSSGAEAKIIEVERRYWEDIKVIQTVLKEEEPFNSQNILQAFSREDYLWAWLNINTRTVSLPLNLPSPTELFNHTMVPILDFANHTSDPTKYIPRPLQIPSPPTTSLRGTRGNNVHLIPGKIGFRLIAPERGMEEGEEVLFEYGAHCNAVLMAEYGFRDGISPPAFEKGDTVEKDWLEGLRYGQVDLENLVEELWKRESQSVREMKEDVLRVIQCLGQNAIVANPYPPHPSYPLLMTLRLLHYPISDPPTQSATQKLEAIKAGIVSFISPENEEKVMTTLRGMVGGFMGECRTRLVRLGKLEHDHVGLNGVDGFFAESADGADPDPEANGMRNALDRVRDMCREEMGIALSLKKQLDSGDTDYT